MPYKDKEKQKEAVKRAVQRNRAGDVIPKERVLHGRPNGVPYDPDELLLDGRKRYLGPFFDGQVLDRSTVPKVVIPPQYQSNSIGKRTG